MFNKEFYNYFLKELVQYDYIRYSKGIKKILKIKIKPDDIRIFLNPSIRVGLNSFLLSPYRTKPKWIIKNIPSIRFIFNLDNETEYELKIIQNRIKELKKKIKSADSSYTEKMNLKKQLRDLIKTRNKILMEFISSRNIKNEYAIGKIYASLYKTRTKRIEDLKEKRDYLISKKPSIREEIAIEIDEDEEYKTSKNIFTERIKDYIRRITPKIQAIDVSGISYLNANNYSSDKSFYSSLFNLDYIYAYPHPKTRISSIFQSIGDIKDFKVIVPSDLFKFSNELKSQIYYALFNKEKTHIDNFNHFFYGIDDNSTLNLWFLEFIADFKDKYDIIELMRFFLISLLVNDIYYNPVFKLDYVRSDLEILKENLGIKPKKRVIDSSFRIKAYFEDELSDWEKNYNYDIKELEMSSYIDEIPLNRPYELKDKKLVDELMFRYMVIYYVLFQASESYEETSKILKNSIPFEFRLFTILIKRYLKFMKKILEIENEEQKAKIPDFERLYKSIKNLFEEDGKELFLALYENNFDKASSIFIERKDEFSIEIKTNEIVFKIKNEPRIYFRLKNNASSRNKLFKIIEEIKSLNAQIKKESDLKKKQELYKENGIKIEKLFKESRYLIFTQPSIDVQIV